MDKATVSGAVDVGSIPIRDVRSTAFSSAFCYFSAKATKSSLTKLIVLAAFELYDIRIVN